jgi:hypothetical protein
VGAWHCVRKLGTGGLVPCNGPGHSGGLFPGAGSNKGSSVSGMKKDRDDFDLGVLNDVAGWLRTPHLHKYTPNFECTVV